MNTEYYVWRKGYGEPGKAHITRKEAAFEAARLARNHPNTLFFVIRTLESAICGIKPVKRITYKLHNGQDA